MDTAADVSDTMAISLVCSLCSNKFHKPHLLPCLHVFCLTCLQDECQGNSPDRFYCPVCVTNDDRDRKSTHARPWHSFERIVEKEVEDEELQKRLSELPAFEDRESWDIESDDDSSGGSGSNPPTSRKPSAFLEPPTLFPCSMHADRLADTFCFKCNQLACNKCISSFHRRCQNFSELKTAVETKRGEIDKIHSTLASNLVACDEVKNDQTQRIKELEAMRTRVLIDIKKYRTELVNMVLLKEKALTTHANRLIDQMKLEATTKNDFARRMSDSLQKQMEFLDLSISVQGEGELLPLFPGMTSRIENDADLIGSKYSEDIKEVTFSRDEQCKDTLANSQLGQVNVANTEMEETNQDGTTNVTRDLNLALVTSFHGGTRDDVTEPLLTDLILLANGDVILTDRDNKCVKKFNQSGKLLTRVIIDAVPSRIATVSHGRAVVSVMTKKALYFLSLFGTVRVLNSVPVKKIYSFLTSIGNGLLVAGTNQCDSIDLLSERGETIRKIFTQKPDRATIARPLYLTPVVPHSSISLKLEHPGTNKPQPLTNGSTSANPSLPTAPAPINSGNPAQRGSISNNIIPSTLPTEKTILPQIVKTGKTGAHTTSSSTTNATSKITRRQSLPATKHTSSSTPPPPPALVSSSTSSTSSPKPTTSDPSSQIDLLVSDSGKRVMFRMQQDGSVNFTLKSKDDLSIECPLGVTVHDSGLTLLSDRDNDCVLLLDEGGNCIKKILTSSDGVTKPCGIYAGNKGVVAMSQVDGMVKIYKPIK